MKVISAFISAPNTHVSKRMLCVSVCPSVSLSVRLLLPLLCFGFFGFFNFWQSIFFVYSNANSVASLGQPHAKGKKRLRRPRTIVGGISRQREKERDGGRERQEERYQRVI